MEFSRQIIDSSPNPIYIRNEHGKFVLVNNAFAKLHGQTADALLSKGSIDIDYSYERDLEIIRSKLAEAVTFEELYKLENGDKQWFSTTKKILTQPDGSLYVLTISSDITPLKKAVQLAEDSEKNKEIFLANMSSEIRTPVNAITELAQSMKKNSLAQEQEEGLNMILSIADNLLSVPDNILDHASLESGKINLVVQPFLITSILNDAKTALKARAEELGVLLNLKEPSDDLIPLVEGDPYRLSQVLFIVTNHAITLAERGKVHITASVKERQGKVIFVEFCVKSSSETLDESKLQVLGQCENSFAQLYGDTARGLTLCKNLIELQGGRMWQESDLSEQSKSFCFNLPYVVSDKAAVSGEKEQPIPTDKLKGLRVLLAEDSRINQLLAMSMLQSWEIDVDLAYDGEEALTKAKEKEYDLILMDIQMPRMDGIEVTFRIRSESNPNQSVPIVAFTANARSYEGEKYQQLGFSDFLFRPCHESELQHIIAANVGQETGAVQPYNMVDEGKEQPLFDFTGLGDLADDALFIRKMQKLFIDTVPDQLAELTDAFHKKNWGVVALTAHRLKSTYGNIKIKDATEALRKIEDIARKKADTDQVGSLLEFVDKITSDVLSAFKSQLDNSGAND
ncbi:response regulator [Pontibacter silvestris]|uniref:histidine kinase n=1 Tax=Pontibacter silvestris TaxID=2305183 RepID=A0ABW4WZB2_9BACT|nr:response regulator [Pontibacter silvestris]MCC9138950.1 response regulator [Pontibacter silvestris]